MTGGDFGARVVEALELLQTFSLDAPEVAVVSAAGSR